MHSLTEARRQIDVDAIVADLKATRRVLDDPASAGAGLGASRETYARTAEALNSQLASARRLEDVIGRADAELRLLDARLAEAVTRAIELSAHAGDATDLGRLGDDVDGVVSEMEALRQALDEAGGPRPSEPTLRWRLLWPATALFVADWVRDGQVGALAVLSRFSGDETAGDAPRAGREVVRVTKRRSERRAVGAASASGASGSVAGPASGGSGAGLGRSDRELRHFVTGETPRRAFGPGRP